MDLSPWSSLVERIIVSHVTNSHWNSPHWEGTGAYDTMRKMGTCKKVNIVGHRGCNNELFKLCNITVVKCYISHYHMENGTDIRNAVSDKTLIPWCWYWCSCQPGLAGRDRKFSAYITTRNVPGLC
ncbi:hypothetical protein ATANTOWER_032580 [Ataeniobius toweri]|uniref:Uncharacterized protein n=1 Tax=Ataeniobius toweri TaxID=208326 RepID=A0ABU7BV81_9TELE|nr:hypothetical protein [Ataeniobius toweri]